MLRRLISWIRFFWNFSIKMMDEIFYNFFFLILSNFELEFRKASEQPIREPLEICQNFQMSKN